MTNMLDLALRELDEAVKIRSNGHARLLNGSGDGEVYDENGVVQFAANVAEFRPGVDPLDPNLFREEPVPLQVFVTDKMYLGQPALSEEQFKAVALGEAVYFDETFKMLDWSYIKEDWWHPGYTELAFMWGKGSGKDFCARIICARVAYLLLCLKDPQRYYNMGSDEYIDILNVARSSNQAAKVFFTPLTRMISRSPWFSDKADPKTGTIEFENGIRAHSGHADQESLEGFNLIIGVADEIASFKTKEEMRTRVSARAGQHDADAIADMMRTSGQSRFPGLAKVVYISYPRFRGDFMTQKVEQARNEPTMYATVKATWEVNPTKSREMFADEYRKDPEGSAAKYECKPPKATNKYFRNDKLIDEAFKNKILEPVDDLGFLVPDTRFDHGKPIAVHLDLALTNDRAAICLAHMQDWSVRHTADGHELRQPIIFPDLITSFGARDLGVSEIDMSMLEDFVVECRRRGARIVLCTADQFQSRYMLQNLQKLGIECRQRSVDRDTSAYDTLKAAIYQGRFVGYHRWRVIEELKGLKLINGVKIDHEPGASKDEADALAGACAGVVELAYAWQESMVHGAREDWASETGSFHDSILTAKGPWSNKMNTILKGYNP